MKAAKSGTVSHSDEDAVSDVSQENVEFPRLIKLSENKIEVIRNGIANTGRGFDWPK